MGDKIILNLDESGNFGKKGRYFTIACVETCNSKPLINVMKKAVVKTKKTFTQFENECEIKASDAFPPIKEYFIRKITSKEDVGIRYIVADLHHVKPALLKDENLLYNYMLSFLVLPVARKRNLKELIINLDKRTIKVQSTNSFENYIKIKANYEMNLGVEITVNYVESHNSYCIQAADFVANAVNSYYEYNHSYYYDMLETKIVKKERFPRELFGSEKVINL